MPTSFLVAGGELRLLRDLADPLSWHVSSYLQPPGTKLLDENLLA